MRIYTLILVGFVSTGCISVDKSHEIYTPRKAFGVHAVTGSHSSMKEILERDYSSRPLKKSDLS